MRKIFTIFFAILALVTLSSCQTVSKKIDEKVAKEEKELSQWLNQPETELKIVFGKPNKIREARLNKKRSRKNNIRKVKVRTKKIEEANAQPAEQ